jgi:Mannosyltransferase (PIG-V)
VPNPLLLDAAPPPVVPRRQGAGGFVAPILTVYVVSRLILIPVAMGMTLSRFAAMWDGRYYLEIAAHGYPTFIAHRGSVVAFFPLYPLLVRVFGTVLNDNWTIASTVVSFLTGAAACLAVGALGRDQAGEETGARSGWLFAFAPGAAFLSVAYAEGLAITLSAASLLLLDRRRWLAAGLIGALATAASSLAFPIVAAAVWAAWRARDTRAWTAPLLAASGFGAYCLFLWARLDTPFGWFDAERIDWHVHVDPFAPFRWMATYSGVSVVEILSLGAALAGMWAMRRARVPGTWWAYTVPVLASVTFNAGAWMSPRFLLSAFPMVAATAIVTPSVKFRKLLLSSGILMLVVIVAYTSFAGIVYQP